MGGGKAVLAARLRRVDLSLNTSHFSRLSYSGSPNYAHRAPHPHPLNSGSWDNEAYSRASGTSYVAHKSSQGATTRPQRSVKCSFALSRSHNQLTGYKIPAIENLGVTRVRVFSHFLWCSVHLYSLQDQHDAIDFTDNSIIILGNLPLLKRLRTLLLANNRIQTISPSLHLSAPNLTTLVLTNNDIGDLGDLEPLKEFKHLTFLSLIGNPVRDKKWYREWLAWRIPSLRVLDFQKIREKVRSPAPTLRHAMLTNHSAIYLRNGQQLNHCSSLPTIGRPLSLHLSLQACLVGQRSQS